MADEVLAPNAKPRLPNHVMLRQDHGRNRWVLLAPERVLTPDAVAVEVLKLCDGERTIESIARCLADTYDAPYERILTDISAMLASLVEKGVIVT